MLKDFGPFGIERRIGSPHPIILAAHLGRLIALVFMVLPWAAMIGFTVENRAAIAGWEPLMFLVVAVPSTLIGGAFFHASYTGLFLDDGNLVVQMGVKRYRVEPSDFRGIEALVVESHTIGGPVDHPGYRVQHDGEEDLRLLAWTVSPIVNRFERRDLDHHAVELEREIRSLLDDQ